MENITKSAAPKKLKLLVTVVNRTKAELFCDLLGGCEVNMQAVLLGEGTASDETMRLLGLSDKDKAVILSVIREDRAAGALEMLSSKFETIKNGKGIAWTVPFDSTIGVAVYRFLSNSLEGAETKWNSHTK